MVILAKPVVKGQYWILKQDDEKVGNVMANGDGYALTINDSTRQYKTIRMLEREANITFVKPAPPRTPDRNQVHGYATGCRVHNAIWDVKHRLPLFTKEPRSKSWFAAGWYRIKQHRSWQIMHNPKLILLERYPYQGPFHTKEQAHEQSV
jgi:hypothetical protein